MAKDAQVIRRQLGEQDVGRFGRVLLIPYHGFEWKGIASELGVVEKPRTKHNEAIHVYYAHAAGCRISQQHY